MSAIISESKKVEKVWGSEEWVVNNDKYCMKHLTLKKGMRCSLHYHKEKDETFVIFSGLVYMEIEDERNAIEGYTMMPGDRVRIKPNTAHRFSGLKNSLIIEVSTHHEDEDSYRRDKSGAFDPESIK